MNYYRNIEIESHASQGYVNLLIEGGSIPVSFEITHGVIMVNMNEFSDFCGRDDVSLSQNDVSNLLDAVESEIGCTLPA